MADHSSKVALITGSTSGIGLATAHALASRGVNVIITGFGDQSTIDGVINDIKTKYNVRANYLAADLTSLSEIDSLWSEIVKLHPDGVDILINNAGNNYFNPIEDFKTEHWDQLIALMLSAPFHLTKHCLPAMRRKAWGRIINMSSAAGLVGGKDTVAYVAAKHGVIGLTKNVALETAANGITCNAVCPGYTETPMFQRGRQRRADLAGVSCDVVEKALLASAAKKQFNDPEQVAELVEFLCLSNASSQMTGATYLIDQGYTAE